MRQETLLHEMIHAYMFLTGNRNTGRDGHGPAFVDKMNEINRSDAFDPMVRRNDANQYSMHQAPYAGPVSGVS